MTTFKRLLVAAAGAAAICGVGAAGASAFAISGGPYIGTNTGPVSFTFDSAYSFDCDTVTYDGNATGAASTSFTPAFDDCSFFGLPATASQSGTWSAAVTSGPSGGSYTGSLSIPNSSTTTLSVPLTGCTVTIDGPQSFGGSTTFTNTIPGVGIQITVAPISYTAVGCPFSSGSHGHYAAIIDLPGVTVS